MFKFNIPAILDPVLARLKAQEAVDKRHEQIAEEMRRVAGGDDEFVVTDVPVAYAEERRRGLAEQMRHPEIDVDGTLDVAPARVVSAEEKRKMEAKAARTRADYTARRRGR